MEMKNQFLGEREEDHPTQKEENDHLKEAFS
jgi:hypothetical protein